MTYEGNVIEALRAALEDARAVKLTALASGAVKHEDYDRTVGYLLALKDVLSSLEAIKKRLNS